MATYNLLRVTSEKTRTKRTESVRFEQEPPSAAASSDSTVALEYLASGETQDLPGSVLVQNSGHVDDDVQISALDAFHGMDRRKSRYIGEVLECIEEKMPEISREK